MADWIELLVWFSQSGLLYVGLFALLAALLLLGMAGYFFWKRIGPFKWVGAVAAKVRAVEGGYPVWVTDSLRETTENGTRFFESRSWGDKFPAERLEPLVRKSERLLSQVRGVRKEIDEIWRTAPDEWCLPQYDLVEEPAKVDSKGRIIEPARKMVKVTPIMNPTMKVEYTSALAAAEGFLKPKSFWAENAWAIGGGLVVLTILASLFILTSFEANQLGAYLGTMNSNTAVLTEATNNLASVLNSTGIRPSFTPTPTGPPNR